MYKHGCMCVFTYVQSYQEMYTNVQSYKAIYSNYCYELRLQRLSNLSISNLHFRLTVAPVLKRILVIYFRCSLCCIYPSLLFIGHF